MNFKLKIYEASVYILLLSLTCAVFISGFQITNLEKENTKLNYVISQKNIKITKLEIDQKIRVNMIQSRVNNIHNILIKLYPGYDYQSKVDNAIDSVENEDFNKQLENMPAELLKAYVQNSLIKHHGADAYQLSVPEISWPLKESGIFNVKPDNEYGTKRPYRYYGYKHEGIDLFNFESDEVLAVYDGYVNDVVYNESEGWYLDIKFAVKKESGKKIWLYTRYRHLDKIFVKKGQMVKKGETVASTGNTGIWSTAKHMHWELYRWNGKKFVNINPVQNSTWGIKYLEELW